MKRVAPRRGADWVIGERAVRAVGRSQAGVPATARRRPPGWLPHAAQLCRHGAVRLPGGQQWALKGIEAALLTDDPRLDSEFSLFTRRARHDAMPRTERAPGWRRPDLTFMTGALVVTGSALTLGWLVSGLRPSPPGTGQGPR